MLRPDSKGREKEALFREMKKLAATNKEKRDEIRVRTGYKKMASKHKRIVWSECKSTVVASTKKAALYCQKRSIPRTNGIEMQNYVTPTSNSRNRCTKVIHFVDQK